MKSINRHRLFSAYSIIIAESFAITDLDTINYLGFLLICIESLLINILLSIHKVQEPARVLSRISPYIYLYTTLAVQTQFEISTVFTIETLCLPLLFIAEKKYKIIYGFI